MANKKLAPKDTIASPKKAPHRMPYMVLCYLCRKGEYYGPSRPQDDAWAPAFLCPDCMKRPEIKSLVENWKAAFAQYKKSGKGGSQFHDYYRNAGYIPWQTGVDDVDGRWEAQCALDRFEEYGLCHNCDLRIFGVRQSPQWDRLKDMGWRVWCLMCVEMMNAQVMAFAICFVANREENLSQSEARARESANAMEAAALLAQEGHEEESFVDENMNPVAIEWEPPRDLDVW
ncbi:hypothetical protein EDC01DRAFT_776596 [Geopyxis carbonaria]|nr:hypothetical protein EDC01DRAFT_776596 [Geopyxis carbonaria]